LGALGGTAAAIAAFIYLKLALHTSLFEKAQETVLLGNRDSILIAVLAIVAAPIFEEFIFRGLIFGGLRRSMGLYASMLGCHFRDRASAGLGHSGVRSRRRHRACL
jgi:ABC-2 type transport system permease protein